MIIGSYIVDFYCAKAGIVIEIDGVHHYWKKQYLYDKKRTEKLESYGLQVIRFTNKEIDTKFESICIFMDKIFNEYIKESFWPFVSLPQASILRPASPATSL